MRKSESYVSLTRLDSQSLIGILKVLHRNGIHHHDVRAENLMVNPCEVVTLVDFDKAVKTDRCRLYCPDLHMIEALQEDMDRDGGGYGYDASL